MGGVSPTTSLPQDSAQRPQGTWEAGTLKTLRRLAPVGAVVSAVLASIHYSQELFKNIPGPSLEKLIKWELGVQTFTVFCLLGFVLESLPRVRNNGWFRDADDPNVKEIFGEMQLAERGERI